jgi:hypothetical protein
MHIRPIVDETIRYVFDELRALVSSVALARHAHPPDRGREDPVRVRRAATAGVVVCAAGPGQARTSCPVNLSSTVGGYRVSAPMVHVILGVSAPLKKIEARDSQGRMDHPKKS